jgi:hypothetical protein
LKTSRNNRTHFVPNVVFKTAFAGVVPLCVAATACSGASNPGTSADSGESDGGDEYFNGAVGCAAFGCGVAVSGFGDGAADAKDEPPPVLAVACAGFCGMTDAGFVNPDTGVDAPNEGGDNG